ncbi:MAG TPA: cytochrome c biogenesis protein ResB [Bacteroidales bacterium]|jgi:hypothetical protein|nr:cytochrome c biogenesis protein ResB [Bacteroidales bacterium]HOF15603.1 cytochrome c biogenesis protein ResB [Bacteroidales bacterium]HOR81448.1 cytochrome c biogenesis protein ResB [Bacteroidales bacterium]HPJ90623.1 cytochrome c biogenesis protein ResB [Bacteroidales bacterium]HQB19122.1 cytochrome c biogenesis protein ResB [Bacteroidales bacterium]
MKRLAKNIISLIAGIVLLLAFSMIPIDIHNFAFPTNLFLLLGLIYFSLLAGRLSERFRFLSSRKAALLSTIAVILLMIIHWLFYHRQIFIGSKLPIVLYDFSSSALFIFTWMFFLLVLGAVIARRLTIVKENNISFLLNHIGLWITLSVGFFGQADSYTLQTTLVQNNMTSQAITKEGQLMELPFYIGLQDIYSEFYSTGEPKAFNATIFIEKNNKTKRKTIAVNHPYRYKSYDIYLMKVGNNSCRVQIVYDPWRYIVLMGIIIMMMGAICLFYNGIKTLKK